VASPPAASGGLDDLLGIGEPVLAGSPGSASMGGAVDSDWGDFAGFAPPPPQAVPAMPTAQSAPDLVGFDFADFSSAPLPPGPTASAAFSPTAAVSPAASPAAFTASFPASFPASFDATFDAFPAAHTLQGAGASATTYNTPQPAAYSAAGYPAPVAAASPGRSEAARTAGPEGKACGAPADLNAMLSNQANLLDF